MKVFKSIINTIINILIVLVLVVSVLVATLALTSKSSGISTVLGYTVQVIMSDSMDGGSDEYAGGDFQSGDVIIGKATHFDTFNTYQEGDIVTYLGELEGYEEMGNQLICHRIIDVQERDGVKVYQTQGDNRSISQLPDQSDVSQYITAASIGAVFHTENYDGIKIEGLGKAYQFINSQLGFFLCILLPMIIFFLYVLIKVVINALEYKRAKEDEKKEQTAPTNDAPAIDTTAQQVTPQMPQMSAEEFEQFKQFMAFKNMQNAYEQSQQTATDTAPQGADIAEVNSADTDA